MASLVEVLCVRDDGHVSHVCDHVALFRHDDFHTDVVLKGSDQSVLRCHRLVLASASPLFAELLALHADEEDVHLLVPHASSHVLSRLLDFCYSGRTLVEQRHLQSLIEVATCLGIKFLKDVIVRVVRAAVKRPSKIQTSAKDKVNSSSSFSAANVKYDAHESHNYAAKFDKYQSSARRASFNAGSVANMGSPSSLGTSKALLASVGKSGGSRSGANSASSEALKATSATSVATGEKGQNVAEGIRSPKTEEIDGSGESGAENCGEGVGQSNLTAKSSSNLEKKLKADESTQDSISSHDQKGRRVDATASEEGDISSANVKVEKTSSASNMAANIARSIKSPQPSVLIAKPVGNEGAVGQHKILFLKSTHNPSLNRIIVPASSSSTAGLPELRRISLSTTVINGPISPSFQVETVKKPDGTQVTFLRQVPFKPTLGTADVTTKQALASVNKLLASTSNVSDNALIKSGNSAVESGAPNPALKVNGKGMSVSQPRHIIPATLPENFLADDEPVQQEQSNQLQKQENEQDSSIPRQTSVQSSADASIKMEADTMGESVDEESVPSTVSSRVSGRLRKTSKRHNKEASNEIKGKSTKLSNDDKPNNANKIDEADCGGNEAPKEQEKTEEGNVPPSTSAREQKGQQVEPRSRSVVNRNEEEQDESASTSVNLRQSKRRSSLAAIEKIDSSKRQRKSLR